MFGDVVISDRGVRKFLDEKLPQAIFGDHAELRDVMNDRVQGQIRGIASQTV